jgi:SAM-dependent methyltransferase
MVTSFRPESTIEEIVAEYHRFVGEELPTWHFPMMNDAVRNSAYDSALGTALQRNKGIVLDIGSGSGLLAMMAARHGAAQVFSCEGITKVANKANEIIKLNGFEERIRVINKLSTDLVVGQDLPQLADVMVTEIFDDGLLGEKALLTIEHAQKNLLKPSAQLIPAGARVIAACIESNEIFENHRVTQAAGFDVSPFNEFSCKNYVGYHLQKMNYRCLSDPKTVFEFDFKKINHHESVPFEFKILERGTGHAIAYWFELNLGETHVISTGPHLEKQSCWRQAVQLFESPRDLKKGSLLKGIAKHNSDSIWFET